jgi:hypothetical protein
MSCGASLEPGVRFCTRCGAAVASVEEPAGPPTCRNCGAELQPGRRFCTACGTPVEAAASPTAGVAPPTQAAPASRPGSASTGTVAGIPRDKLPLAIGGVAAVVIVIVLALTVFGGGGDDGGGSSVFGGGSSGLGPDIGLAKFPEPVPVDLPEGDSLLGSNNRRASTAIQNYLAESGVDMTGIDLFVFPVADAGESLLVIDADLETLMAISSSDSGGAASDDAMANLINLPEVQEANVTRVAMNLRASDEQGPYVMTLTLPIGALDPNNPEYADLSDEEALQVYKVQITR